MKFHLKSPYLPAGDQAQAIDKLSQGIADGSKHQVLLGVTGSGKTYTLANVIAKTQKPTLIISHNKTLAAQLYQEFKEYFPQNGVGFFISYYDYFQPEAYIPQTDTYIAKETDVNQEIEKLRLQATSLLFSRQDVIIVASVSCIYNLGSPIEYGREVIELIKRGKVDFGQLINRLVDLNYIRTRLDLSRGTFRVRGDILEVFPAYGDEILKIEAKSGVINEIILRPVFSGQKVNLDRFVVYPAKHFMTNKDTLNSAFKNINSDLKIRLKELNKQNKIFEAHRLEQKVKYDLEMIREAGYVNGIENYSRYFDGRRPGDPPWSLVSYFCHVYGQNFLVIIDESHISVPQIRGMYRGDLSRKKTLIDFGFRLPSCLDNRPLKFAEFLQCAPQIVYDSATPGDWEINQAKGVVEQLIRPTGLVDPEIKIKPAENQVKDLLSEILKRKVLGQRVLVTTLTKKMAEELANWLADIKNTGKPVQVHYLHADVKTLERSDILTDLRTGKYDVIVGVNLLREGLDLPEVSLVAILDADKQGFLRSKISLIQTMGRAARHITGKVILYADEESLAMREAIEEVNRRRQVQLDYNQTNNITPQGISKPIRERIVPLGEVTDNEIDLEKLTPGEAKKLLPKLRRQMREAASILDFEKAAKIRDLIREIVPVDRF
jgi:excinuclease ABC subunit B